MLRSNREKRITLFGFVDCRGGRRIGDSTDIDVHGKIPGVDAVFGEANHHQAERF